MANKKIICKNPSPQRIREDLYHEFFWAENRPDTPFTLVLVPNRDGEYFLLQCRICGQTFPAHSPVEVCAVELHGDDRGFGAVCPDCVCMFASDIAWIMDKATGNYTKHRDKGTTGSLDPLKFLRPGGNDPDDDLPF